MTESIELLYPTVNLFLYDLRDGLGQSLAQTEENRRKFWQKIDPQIDEAVQKILEIHHQSQSGFDSVPNLEDLKQSVNQAYSLVQTKPADLANQENSEADSLVQSKLANFASKENSEADFVNIHYQSFDENPSENHLDGYQFALQLGDTYSLQVDASDVTLPNELEKRSDTKRPISQIKALKQLVVSKVNHHSNSPELDSHKQGTLGQTWLFWGQLTDSNLESEQLKKIAEACFEQLKPQPKWKPIFSEIKEIAELPTLAGARLFEYSRTPTNWSQDWEKFNPENYHLIILLFPAKSASTKDLRERMAQIYFDLTKLFAYRHKIIWSYWNSRKIKQELKVSAEKMNRLIQQIEQYSARTINLDALQTTLTESLPALSNYAVKLNQLSSQAHTIKINLDNYNKRLKKLEEDPQNNLTVLRKFATTAEERYLQQVEMDKVSLTAGLTILENLTRTLGTVIDIEQTKSDRNLNYIIAAASIGLATSGVTATILSTQVYQPENTQNNRISVTRGFLLSLSPILAFVLVVWYLRWQRRKSR